MQRGTNMAIASMMTGKVGLIRRHIKTSVDNDARVSVLSYTRYAVVSRPF